MVDWTYEITEILMRYLRGAPLWIWFKSVQVIGCFGLSNGDRHFRWTTIIHGLLGAWFSPKLTLGDVWIIDWLKRHPRASTCQEFAAFICFALSSSESSWLQCICPHQQVDESASPIHF